MSKKITVPKKSTVVSIVVASLEKKAGASIAKLKKLTAIKTQEDYAQAAEQMKAIKMIAAEAAKKEKEMLAGIKSTEKLIRSHFKPFKDKVLALDNAIKAMMNTYLISLATKKQNIDKDFENGKIKSISKYTEKVAATTVGKSAAKVREIEELEIEDEKKIPREYLIPDERAIEAALKEGRKVPGCKLVKRNSIAI